jgi:APA family basic amino acid/polyamine antiporter
MASSWCAVRLAQRQPALLSRARIRLEKKTLLFLGRTGMLIGLALLGIGLTTDPRPYELIAGWSVLGLLYWWTVGARGSRNG